MFQKSFTTTLYPKFNFKVENTKIYYSFMNLKSEFIFPLLSFGVIPLWLSNIIPSPSLSALSYLSELIFKFLNFSFEEVLTSEGP